MTREEIIKGLFCGYDCTEKDECFESGCKGCIDLMFRKYEQQIKADVIDKCKQILMDAMARDGKTKCHEYMIAFNEMEELKL